MQDDRTYVGDGGGGDAREREASGYRLLGRISAALAAACDFEAMLDQVARSAVPGMADLCVVELWGEGGSIGRSACAHAEPAREGAALAHVRQALAGVEGAGPVLLPEIAGAGDDEARPRSLLRVPLVALGRRLGAITLAATGSGRRYDELDLRMAEELGRRAAAALENAWRHAASQHEIRERSRAEEALRESEARFRATFEQAAVGLAHMAPDGQWLWVNERLCDIVGYSRDELLRRTLQDITHPDDVAPDLEQLNRLVAGAIECYRMEKRYLRKDATVVWVHLTRSIVRGADGAPEYLISVVQDITERKRLEQQFLQAQKLEAVGRLAGGIAHDFNNALSGILGLSQFVLMDLPERSPMRGDLEQIVAAGKRASALTRQLLTFSRGSLAEVEAMDLNALATDMRQMVHRLLGEDIEFYLSLDPSIGRIRASPSQIEQVIMNLALNARDAMPEGGRLHLETRTVHLEPEYARTHFGTRPGAYVMLAVSDTGHGMTPEVQAQLFEPFFTTKPAGQGTGLGLSTVYGIVKQAGGTIQVYSEPGHGTAFKVYLPTIDEVETPHRPGEEPVRRHRGSESILLVEDDATVRSVARRALEMGGYRVQVAASGEEALAICRRPEVRIDLLLTDVVMPGINGRELSERVASLRPGVRVLFMSGYTTDEVLRRGILHDEVAFLEKPFSPEELVRKVWTLLHGEAA